MSKIIETYKKKTSWFNNNIFKRRIVNFLNCLSLKISTNKDKQIECSVLCDFEVISL